MDEEPPTKAKPSAEEQETPDDRRARLLQLAADYLSAFRHEPNEESLEMWQLLLAIGSSPDRRRRLAQYERQLGGKAARTDPAHPDKFWRKAWVRLVQPLVANCEGDPEEVARTLIGTLPAELQTKCPGYPTNETELKAAAANVLARPDFREELALWRKCGDLDTLKVIGAVLQGLGMKYKDWKSLRRSDPWASEKPPEEVQR